MTYVKRTKWAKPDPDLVKPADGLLANYKKPEDLIGENGLLKQLTKMLVERPGSRNDRTHAFRKTKNKGMK